LIGRILQWVADAESIPGDGPLLRFRRKLRWVILRVGDPAVQYQLARHRLWIPLSHEMPGYRRVHPTYDSPLAVLASAFVKAAERPVRAIDIGGNVGDSAVVLADAGVKSVLCVEGLETYLRLLRINVGDLPEVVIAPVFVTEYVANLGGHAARGTAVVSPAAGGTTSCTFSDLLRDYPEFVEAQLVKIDTDGWDLAVLRSAANWLEQSRATVFFEYDPALEADQGYVASEVWSLLSGIGYPLARIWSNTGLELWAGPMAEASAVVDAVLASHTYVDVMVGFSDPLAS
jgi:FkbM family methyltransferase